MTWLLLAVLTIAAAGISHIVTILALPWHSKDDAYARVVALTPTGSRALLPPPDTNGDRLPLRDPAMLTAVCRFDLASSPFHIATSPFADRFVTLGFHSRHGVAFYGLTIQASDPSSLDLVLNATQDGGDTRGTSPDSHQVVVPAPEAQGFVTLATPLDDITDRGAAEERLDHFQCVPAPAGS